MSQRTGLLKRMASRIFNRLDSKELAELIAGSRSASGEIVNHESALAVSTVYACVRIIGETVGSLPLRVYHRMDKGGKERAVTHPLYNLLSARPNPWQTPMEFGEQMIEHLALRGNYYGGIIRAGDIITDIIPLHPDRVEVKQLQDYSLMYEVTRKDGTKMPLLQREVLHIRAMPGTDGITGRSVLGHQKDLIGAAMATQKYSGRLFKNDATPGVVITYPKSLTEAALKRLKESWGDQYSGENVRKTAILEDGASIEKLSMNADEAQFMGTRRLQRSEIASLFRVPLILLQADEDVATYASAEQFMLSFLVHCIRPWLVRIEQAMHRSLFTVPRYYYPQYNAEAILRGDINTRYKAYSVGRQWGWLSVNEIRDREDMNPIEGGDTYLEPLNMTDASKGDKDEK
ncbi:MAG: phage portal protein [Clostridia bacterium]